MATEVSLLTEIRDLLMADLTALKDVHEATQELVKDCKRILKNTEDTVTNISKGTPVTPVQPHGNMNPGKDRIAHLKRLPCRPGSPS